MATAPSVESPLSNVKSYRQLLDMISSEVQRTGNTRSLLPLLYRFSGKPVTLDSHFPFEICFFHRKPARIQKLCARQVGKSFQNALEIINDSILIPHWNTLYVTPLFETVRRFSTLYVRTLIDNSPAKRLMTLKGATSQVLQRTLGTQSTIFFSYAQRDADRIRGIQADQIYYDEVQLMLAEVFPVIQQVMGAAAQEIERFAGTPLSHINHSQKLFAQSTQSEWMIHCETCGKDNIASIEYDLMEMIGPAEEDIGPGNPGTRCRKCKGPLYPERGRWLHRYPDRRDEFVGIHVPQPIMPWHAYSYTRWKKLNHRLVHGSKTEIYNEILGEPCDSSFKPVSIIDLKRASVLNKNTVKDAMAQRQRYVFVAMGIDWGGGGASGISRTKAAIIGITSMGKTDVFFGVDLNFSASPFEEVRALAILGVNFEVDIVAFDAGGGVGATREDLFMQTRVPFEMWPMTYVGPTKKGLIIPHPATKDGDRTYFTIDKARSLDFTCEAIKQGHLRFFEFDFISDDNPGLVYDFTALTSEISPRVMGSEVLLIGKEDGVSDDFAHAVNLGSHALWAKNNAWPKLSSIQDFASTQQLANMANDIGDQWDSDEIESMLRRVQMSDRL